MQNKMDNPLTPKKIQKLINLAGSTSFNIDYRLLLTDEEVKLVAANHANMAKSPARYESSSGILDLDHIEAFGECGSTADTSISKSNTFNPGEMTGRSTGADDAPPSKPTSELYGRHSIGLDSITSKMDKQTNEINDLMRHSIATNYSFHSKRDLTADEASLINREAPLPILQTTQTYFADTPSANGSCLSVGAYFKERCEAFGKILASTDSPDKSAMPSITEVSNFGLGKDTDLVNIDDTLDSVPVRQPRYTDTQMLEKPETNTGRFEKSTNAIFKEPARPKLLEKGNKVPEKPSHIRALNPTAIPHKSFSSMKPTDVLLKNLQSSFKQVSEDTEEGSTCSFSISKIADYLEKQSNVSVTDILQLQKKPAVKKLPLSELSLNTQNTKEVHVTKLIDSKKTETASSSGTLSTVVSFDKLNIQPFKLPQLIVTHPTIVEEEPKCMGSKSPSNKSPSTLSTVRENNSNYSSFKSGDSPNSSKDKAGRSKPPSPNLAYKELDKSVDWQEVLQQKKVRQRGVAKEQWVEIIIQPVDGFVGVCTPITITVNTLSDSWLTATFQFNSLPHEGRDLNVELPRLPLLLSPGKSEAFTFSITSNVEMSTELPFTFFIKDASMDGDMEHKGELPVNFKLPVIQAMSADGMNKLTYPAIHEKLSLTKTFVLISDCPADLQLKLHIAEGDTVFCIKHVQEVKKSDVNKVLLERQGFEEQGKTKAKVLNKQLCRIVKDSAIRVSITFNAPKLSDLKGVDPSTKLATLNGVLLVSLIGADTVLRKVDLVGVVGTPNLVVKASGNNIHVASSGSEATTIAVVNEGAVAGNWSVRYRSTDVGKFPFNVMPNRFSLRAGESQILQIVYTGGIDDGLVEMPIRFEESTSGTGVELTLTGGSEKPKSFPIKSNTFSLSWVRAGRKEVSLKNNIDKKVHIRCQIVGDGFSIDLPGGETRGIYVVSFNGCECRPLPIMFTPTHCMPHAATLHMAYDRNSDYTRKIKLFGCVSGEPVRWSGLVTYSDTAALVRAVCRAPLDLKMHNKSTMPAFVAAKVHFNLQYMPIEPLCCLVGANKVVAGRAYHTISLKVDWARVERRAREVATTALATVTVITGAESTRRRIIKILKEESKGKLDVSLLPDHLKVLTQQFDGEDSAIDNFFHEFSETRASLNELIGGLQELTAHIDLPSDFADENTVIITDDTILEHHTLCD